MNKKGNVLALIGIIMLVIILLAMFILQYQINVIVRSIRNDLFYISNNVIVAMDKEELFLANYMINNENARMIIQDLMNKNHVREGGYIKAIKVVDAYFNTKNKVPSMYVEIKVTFKPLIKIGNKSEYEFTMKENAMISLLQYS